MVFVVRVVARAREIYFCEGGAKTRRREDECSCVFCGGCGDGVIECVFGDKVVGFIVSDCVFYCGVGFRC